MDVQYARALRRILSGTGWVEETRRFARAMRCAGHDAGGLLVVGTPAAEPWHFTAHLDDEARWSELPELRPTLVRHHVPADAPAHLAVDLSRLEATRRGETLLIVAPSEVPGGILERFDDARRRGATLLALEGGDRDVRSLAHESLTVLDAAPAPSDHDALWLPEFDRPDGLVVTDEAGFAFETAQHLVSLAAGEQLTPVGRRRGFRDKLGRLLDRVSG